jgi:hypothetical protein
MCKESGVPKIHRLHEFIVWLVAMPLVLECRTKFKRKRRNVENNLQMKCRFIHTTHGSVGNFSTANKLRCNVIANSSPP